MQTLGYRFRPWTGAKAIADGPSILAYVRETAAEAGIDAQIRYGHKVVRAEWSTPDARWTVHAEGREPLSCRFLLMCSGYYRYDEGYTPPFEGARTSTGEIVHPQFWPEDLDYAGKRVVVIGSGATAVTLVPALADSGAGHVTMLQRSPSYVLSLPDEDPIASALRRRLGDRRAYAIVRWKNVALATLLYQLSQRLPRPMRGCYRAGALRQLPGRLRRRHPLQPALQAMGPAAVPRPQRRPVRRPSATAARRSSPPRSSASRERGIRLRDGRASSRPT